MFLTGSRALNFWYPNDFPIKPETDWDIVSDVDIKMTKIIDVAPEGLNSFEICSTYSTNELIETPIGIANVVSPKGLMLFKRSHLHRPIDFAKHIRHYHFLKSKVIDLDEVYYNLLKERTRLTKEKYGDKVPSLKKSKKDFFDDYVTKKYEHDQIHRAISFYDRPLYEELKTDDESVWCSKDKWEQLPHQKKIYCILEEAYVISIERYLIPNNKFPRKFAFYKSIEKICTTLTSGWFRDYATENWTELMSHSDYDFYKKFLEKESTLSQFTHDPKGSGLAI